MGGDTRKAMLADHFAILVYPFHHAVEGKERLSALAARWRPWWQRLDDTGVQAAVEDAGFFLPHVRSLLFPEIASFEPASEEPAGNGQQVSPMGMNALDMKLRPQSVLHWTLREEQAHALGHLTVHWDADGSASFQVCWVDALLFPQGVGFLVLKIEMIGPRPTVEGLVDLLSRLRLVQPPSLGWVLPTWTTEDESLQFHGRTLVSYLLQAMLPGATQQASDLAVFCRGSNDDHIEQRLAAEQPPESFGSRFRVFTYACLDSPREQARDPGQGTLHGRDGSLLFSSGEERALYELATLTRTSNPDYEPDPVWLRHLFERGHIAFWSNWHGMALHDNVAFLGMRSTPFTRESLPHNIESDYFPLYLLTLYQKIRLESLAAEVVRRRGNLYRNAREARVLRSSFVQFRSHYWFADVTARPQGGALYRTFRDGLEVYPLYESIESTVREIDEYYERTVQRRIGSVLTLLTLVGVPAGILSQLYGPVLAQGASRNDAVLVTVSVYAVIAVGWIIWRLAARD